MTKIEKRQLKNLGYERTNGKGQQTTFSKGKVFIQKTNGKFSLYFKQTGVFRHSSVQEVAFLAASLDDNMTIAQVREIAEIQKDCLTGV